MPRDDSEHRLLEAGGYSNIRVATARREGRRVTIEAGSIPWIRVVLFLGLFFGFAFGLVALFDALPTQNVSRGLVVAAAYGIAGFVSVLFTGIVIAMYRRERRAGPWAVFDAEKGTVELPRDGVTLTRADIRGLQVIHGWPSNRRGQNVSKRTELNLLTTEDGEARRRPLLRALSGASCFDDIVAPIEALGVFPITRATAR